MTASRTTARRSRLRTLVQGCVIVFLLLALLQTWFIDGLVIPCRVTGGSMAGALLGVHRDVVCADCRCPFSCGIDVGSVPTRAVCPNCGYAANDLEPLPDINGDRVLIDRNAFSTRQPRRWEIAALRQPGSNDQLVVKRIVGLPGESIAIRNGDVYADGHIQRKNLAEQRAMAILVNDANFRPTQQPTPPPCWQPDRADSRWSQSGEGFVHAASPTEPADWLVYHHWRRLPGSDGVQESPITDLCGYNQSQPRREEDVHSVTDVMLSFQLGDISGQGVLYVRAADGHSDFQTQLLFNAASPRYQVLCNGQPIPEASGQLPAANGERLVEVSLVDQQFLLAIDGQTVVAWPYDRPESQRPDASCRLAIGAEGLAAAVHDVRVLRDVYYTHPIGPRESGIDDPPVHLAAEEYYVLGDNSPISDDSRTWPDRGVVNAKLLIGKPLVAIPSVSISVVAGRYFQVPNPVRIRYIR